MSYSPDGILPASPGVSGPKGTCPPVCLFFSDIKTVFQNTFPRYFSFGYWCFKLDISICTLEWYLIQRSSCKDREKVKKTKENQGLESVSIHRIYGGWGDSCTEP